MTDVVEVHGVKILLAEPMQLPPVASLKPDAFIGRERDLALCRAAWDVAEENLSVGADAHRRWRFLAQDGSEPLNFRLEGLPGTGKNEIIYQLARELEMDLYVVQGHEELTPEDLALLIVPDSGHSPAGAREGIRAGHELPLVVRASPLATALLKGGLFFFDEINRVPERALSPLAPVLDGRRKIYSALTGLWLEPRDAQAAARFRFACALNPEYGQDLPAYIAQRTLPRIEVKPAELDDLVKIIRANVAVPDSMIRRFRRWYRSKERGGKDHPLSTRQAIQLLRYTSKLSTLQEYRDAESEVFKEALTAVVGTEVAAA